jgi:hypothetical protein
MVYAREHRPEIRALERGPWALLQAIAPHWQGRTEAFPGQDRLALLTGYDVRSVRHFTDTLEGAGLVRLRRERRPDGSERIHYAPGPALIAAAEAFRGRYPECAKPLSDVPMPIARQAHPPETLSGRPAEAVSGELSDLEDRREPSSSCARSTAPANEEQAAGEISEIDRDVARAALAEHRRRRFPDRSATLFDAKDVATVAACSSAIGGDGEAKLRAQLDALEGAFVASKGAPTVRYVWGSLDYFFGHELRGRLCREQAAQERARRASAGPALAAGGAGDVATAPLSALECSRRHRVRLRLVEKHHANGRCPYCERPAEVSLPEAGP